MHWSDQKEVKHSTTLCFFYIGDGLSVEIEIISDGGVLQYRLTMGSLFVSESMLYPYDQTGLENLLKTLMLTRNVKGPTQPVGGIIEDREHHHGRIN